MKWKTIAEDSVKKAKTQRRKRQKIPSLSVMTHLDVDVLWLGVTRKQPGSQGMNIIFIESTMVGKSAKTSPNPHSLMMADPSSIFQAPPLCIKISTLSPSNRKRFCPGSYRSDQLLLSLWCKRKDHTKLSLLEL